MQYGLTGDGSGLRGACSVTCQKRGGFRERTPSHTQKHSSRLYYWHPQRKRSMVFHSASVNKQRVRIIRLVDDFILRSLRHPLWHGCAWTAQQDCWCWHTPALLCVCVWVACQAWLDASIFLSAPSGCVKHTQTQARGKDAHFHTHVYFTVFNMHAQRHTHTHTTHRHLDKPHCSSVTPVTSPKVKYTHAIGLNKLLGKLAWLPFQGHYCRPVQQPQQGSKGNT